MRPGDSFVGQPIRSLQTMLRVLADYNGAVPTLIPDGIYGKETRDAIIIFQKNNGLPVTGIADQITWEKIAEQYDNAIVFIDQAEPLEIIMNPNKIYVLGDYSPNLLIAQTILYYLSGKHERISTPSREGTLDNATSSSIASFQKINGLPATGNLDKKTWQLLSRQYTLNANNERNI